MNREHQHWALLDGLAREAAEEAHCPSLVWGLVHDGVLATAGSAGALPDGSEPDEHTVYRIASMTKSFTAAAVLGLRDDGALSLDVPVAHYAPELATVEGPTGSPPITLRHLLSMTSGLATDDAWADRHLDATPEWIDRVYAAGPLFATGTGGRWEYSNLGYGMIGRVVQRVTGVRLQQHVEDRLLRPLRMHDTSWTQPAHTRWAPPFRYEDDAIVADDPAPVGDGEISPMGGLWTTVADLARWVAWLDSANVAPHQPDAVGLSAASRREMQQMHTYIGLTTVAGRTSPAGYCFGLNLRDDHDLGIVVAHAGGLPGYGSNMRWLRGRGLGVVALANVTYAPMAELTLRMLAALHDAGAVPTVAPLHSPAVDRAADRLVALLNRWSDDAADALFADNVALDEALLRRRAAAARLLAEHGPLRIVEIRAQKLTAGVVTVQGRHAPFGIEFDLAPLADERIQFYGLTS